MATEPDPKLAAKERTKTALGTPGVSLGRVGGIQMLADWSLLIVLLLIATSLGTGLFPQWHPDWSVLLTWTMAIVSAALFFLSVWLHELAHALTAKRFGLEVPSITLFLFGGVTQIRDQPDRPGVELTIAAVGPLTSIAIGVIGVLAGSQLAGPTLTQADTIEEGISQLGPVASMLLWLGPVNLLLGVFNLVPGFPLDGGRMLRALLWRLSGSFEQATRWSSYCGRAVAWALMGCGVAMMFGAQIPILGSGLFNGLWLVLIGWFLNSAALMSYRQVMVRAALSDVPVRRLMLEEPRSVPPSITVEAFVYDHLMKHDQQAYPVIDGDTLVGLICVQDVRRVPRDRWPDVTVAEIATPADRLATASPQDDAAQAAQRLGEEGYAQMPVVDGNKLLGLFRRSDLTRWLSMNQVSQGRAA